jgi:hypothetical protein
MAKIRDPNWRTARLRNGAEPSYMRGDAMATDAEMEHEWHYQP